VDRQGDEYACFIVYNKNGQALGYFYFSRTTGGRRVAARPARIRQRFKKCHSACREVRLKLTQGNGDYRNEDDRCCTRSSCDQRGHEYVVAGSANAQQIGSVQEGRQLAREVCAECHAIDNAADGSTNPNAPDFKVIANTPGMTSAALTVALQTTHVTMPNFV
jgi:hypothetical protein